MYNIPVSNSDAMSSAQSLNTNAGVNFNFGTAWYDQETDQTSDFEVASEATSSASTGGAANSAGGGATTGGSNNQMLLYVALALAAFAAYKSIK